jgi:hypothetical protein
MKILSITILITVLLFAGGMAAVYRMPAPEVTASKYILHIDPGNSLEAAPADTASRSAAAVAGTSSAGQALAPENSGSQMEQAVKQQLSSNVPASTYDDTMPDGRSMAGREREMAAQPGAESAPAGSPWDTAFNNTAANGPSPGMTATAPPAGEAAGQKSSDRLTPAVRRIPAPAEAAPEPAFADEQAVPSSNAAAEPAYAGGGAAMAAGGQQPSRVAAASEAQPANSWLTQQSAAPNAKPVIPPMPRRRADQLPPIPRGAGAPVEAAPAADAAMPQ